MIENVYEIRKKNNLYFILDSYSVTSTGGNCLAALEKIQKETIIVVNLYYDDLVDNYIEYILNIPQKITVLLVSSNERVIEKLQTINFENNVRIISKENRGRDISALLVATRNYVIKYKYACFIHDKKANSSQDDKFYLKWNEALWSNTLDSTCFINNVLMTFEENPKVGVLMPPDPLSDDYNMWYENTWFENVPYAIEFADRFGLKTDITYDITFSFH